MDIITLQQAFESIGLEIKNGIYHRYYEAKSTFENLEEQKKTMLAVSEMKQLNGTQTEITRKALVDSDYLEFLEGLAQARIIMNRTFAKLKALEARLDIYRSLNKHFDNTNL